MTATISNEIKNLLDKEVERINRPDFITKDPVQFPRRFSNLQDIEIVSLCSAIIAWGRRDMICRDIERLLILMDNNPYKYVREGAYESLDPKLNIHRTLFAQHLKYLLRGLRRIYNDYGSLDAFSQKCKSGNTDTPSWHLAGELQKVLCDENNGETCSQCLPVNLTTTPLKRFNMALRWLVRDDRIVDMGVWKSIPKSKLYIPLDVHVANTSRSLGILTRKSNDRKSVELLTSAMRSLRPDDPAIYDFALFGIGITGNGR